MKKWIKKHGSSKLMILFLFVGFVLIFLIIAGSSYAYFVTTVKGKEMVIYTGTLAVNYAKKTDVINNLTAYPMSDTEGLATTAHEFTVTNNGNIDARYRVRLETDSAVTNMIDLRYVKISYQVDGNGYSTPMLLSDLGGSLVFIKNNVLTHSSSNTIGIKLWIDLNAGNDIQNKEFKARIVVDSIQNVDDGYVVDTIPIIYLNKDSSGNQDIHLTVGDTYNDLGVEKIEDDKDIFTTDQATISYEYYDGSNLNVVSSVDTSKTGIYYVNYSVTDSANNTCKVTRVVTVNNSSIIPSISLVGDSSISLGEGDYYKENGATIADNNRLVIVGEVNTKAVGTYTIRYIVVDSNGNVNSVVRTVTVNSKYKEGILNGTDPVLADNLVPVVISDSGVAVKASSASDWYSYENKNWANSVILKDKTIKYQNGEIIPEDNIESYFVWIPKYSYQIWDLGNYSSLTSLSSKEQEVKIKFGTSNTSDSVSGECATPFSNNQGIAGSSGNCKVGNYMTHPAFLAFDTTGLWVGKFETGYDGATSTALAQVNSNDSSKIIIKPNVYSWRGSTVGNMFKASYDYLRNAESHMMKNTEWGAVSYLHHSKYGSMVSLRINNNSSYITGYAATVEPTLGYNSGTSIEGSRVEETAVGVDGAYTVNYLNNGSIVASTTGNKTGIYDMSGGAWEYVVGYTTGASTVGGASEITSVYSNFFTNNIWNKYYDKYTSTLDINYDNRILGDATGEIGPFGSEKGLDDNIRYKSSWYKDHAFFAYSSNPWFFRGCHWAHGTNTGAFSFGYYAGGADLGVGFRIVLAP